MENKMNISDIDFDERLLIDFGSETNFFGEELTSLIYQTEQIINNENEPAHKKAEAYVNKFQLLMYQFKLAPKLLEKALALCPDMPQALVRMGVFFNNKKEYDEEKTLEYINKAINIAPSYACSYMLRAYITRGNKEQCISDFENYIKLKPDSYLGYEEYGNYLKYKLLQIDKISKKPDGKLKQEINKAIFAFSEAIRLNPANYNNYYNRAQIYLLKEHICQTEQDHQNTLSDIINFFLAYPEDDLDQVRISLNNIFFSAKDSLKNRYYTEIIENIAPEKAVYKFVTIELADLIFYYKRHKKSIELITKIIEENPKDSIWCLYGLAKRACIYEAISEYGKAIDDYNQIAENSSWINGINISDDNGNKYIPYEIQPIQIYQKRADIYKYNKIKNNDEKLMKLKAIDEYSKIIKIAEKYDLKSAYMDRASLYYSIGEYDKAMEDCNTIIFSKTEPAFVEAYQLRIELFMKQGNKEKAFDDFVKMYDIMNDPDDLKDDIESEIESLFAKRREYEVIEE
jgi:tetratricopeptide (TPR) repeat protein